MAKKLKIFVISGEASGDLLGSEIIKNISLKNKNCEFLGIAGKKLQEQNVKSIFPISEISVMGFFEVVPKIPKILKLINFTIEKIKKFQPDIIITIDAPDFSFRVVKKLKKSGFNSKYIHIVAPTVWAYREKRAEKIAKLYDKLLVLLPFEPPYFTKYGLDTKFIGHPLISKKYSKPKSDLLKKYKIPKTNKIITVTLGSRKQEIEILAPIFKQAIEKLSKDYKNLTIVIPSFKKFKNEINNFSKDLNAQTIFVTDENEKIEFFKKSEISIAKSGTNMIEIALQKTALIICYKVNLLTFILLKIMVRTKYVNLINILAKKEIIAELIQYKCNPENIYKNSIKLLNDNIVRKKQITEQNKYLEKFKNNKNTDPAMFASNEILNLL